MELKSFVWPVRHLACRLVVGMAIVGLSGGRAAAQGGTMDITQADKNRLLNGPLTWDQLRDPDFTSGRLSENWDNAKKIDIAKRVTPCAPEERKLWPDGKTGPDPSLLPTQGTLSDCGFVAAAMALARLNPDAIKNMIQDHGDGTFTVSSPAGRP